MDSSLMVVIGIILLAYVFDFINGFHDAANSIATIVTTGVLTPRIAVIWAAFFNFIPFLFTDMTVAKTIGKDLVDVGVIGQELIFSALIAAIFWGIATWYYGLPTSLSQALIGGLVGGALAHSGLLAIKWTGILKVIVGIFISPIMGLILGLSLTYTFTHFLKNKKQSAVNNFFKWMQLTSSACLSMAHGANDSQKTMGIITILLFSSSILQGEYYVPFWVIVTCYSMIALGTLTGGYRIMRTLGSKITKLNTLRGCGAETAAMVVIFSATGHGVPVSTTQTVTGAIAGVGLVKGLSGTCWPMLKLIFFSWFVTMPATAGIAAFLVWLIA